MMKPVGVLNILLAVLMGLGAFVTLVFVPDAWLDYEKEPEDFFLSVFLFLYAACGAAAALSIGLASFGGMVRAPRLPLTVHLTSGLFLSVNLCLVLAGLVLWHRYGVGVSADVEIIIVLGPLFVIGPSYALLLTQRARLPAPPTP